jgi:CRISPR-associated protein Cmr6
MAIRDDLGPCRLAADTHAGLWLDRYLRDLDGEGAKQEHLDEVLDVVRVPAGYPRFFARWRAALESLPDTRFARAETTGRLIVGLGAESVLETSLTLHQIYGVPYLPGSALKGLAAAAAHRRLTDHASWRKAGAKGPIGESHRVLFGDTKASGYVTFHDALWIPEGTALPLDPDVLTVHHPRYYGGEAVPPADWDSPVPVPFVTAHGAYLLALTGPPAWTEAAHEILAAALAQDGLGAKTAAGYGRFQVQLEKSAEPQDETTEPARPANPTPEPGRRYRRGERIQVEVIGTEGRNRYALRPLEGGGPVVLQQGGLQWEMGDRKKVKVLDVTPDGRITRVGI